MEIIARTFEFLQPAETELQTETEIGLQKITTFQQILRYTYASSIFNDPGIIKNSK